MQTIRTKHRNHSSPGICGNCVHDKQCVFQRNSPDPITLCEEHEIDVVLEPIHITIPERMKTPPVPGICGTCDNLETCALRSKEHVIYHCEHYR
jgi:hypothetical protein